MKAAYIHIPFCRHICHYCDFNKVFIEKQPVDEYVVLLQKEMSITLEQEPAVSLDTIFVGGGTPTALNEQQLAVLCKGIRETLPFNTGEFTFEANPGDLSKEKLQILYDYGVNRLSFGVQSFDNGLLEKIGRSHRAEDVYTSIEYAQAIGIDNISIDLMYALPGQTETQFHDTLKKATALQLPHYSIYSLIVEPKTIFYNLMKKGKLHLPTEDSEARMYELAMNVMQEAGLHQYEISNFSKRGFESKHNLVYWNNETYYGFGAGAHSYMNGKRRSNCGPLKHYMTPLTENKLPIYEEQLLTVKEKMEEEMFLGLRKTAGVSIEHFEQKFSCKLKSVFSKPIQEMTSRGLLEEKEGALRLTTRGKFFGNEVFQAFLLS